MAGHTQSHIEDDFGHTYQDCRKKNSGKTETKVQTIICNYCKKPGQLISVCRKRKYNNNLKNQQNQNSQNQNGDNQKPFARITNIKCEKGNYTVRIKTDSVLKGFIRLLVDTGADISLLKLSVLDKEKTKSINSTNKELLSGVGEGKFYTFGTLNVITQLGIGKIQIRIPYHR